MLANFKNKRTLEEATSNKDEVAPVYLLEELWQTLKTSGPEVSTGFIEFVNKRLTNKSPIVKQKTLRLVKFICDKGSSEFKRGIAKSAQAVRELTHYRGDSDPFKGDAQNQKVRDSAKEALTAMFAATAAPSYQQTQTPLQSRIKGFGSENAGGFSSSTSSSRATPSSGMLGFGNPKSSNRAPQSSRSSKFLSSSTSGYEGGREGNKKSDGIGGMMARVGSGALSPKGIMNSISARGNELMGKRGPGILDDADQTGYDSDGADRGYTKPSAETLGLDGTATSHAAAPRQRNLSRSGEEARLVNQICTPGGMRAQPSQDDLRIFVESAGSLEGSVLAQHLEDKLADSSWQAVLRALCAIEAVIKQGSTAACGEIAVHFQSEPGAIEAAVELPQASVRQRAQRVLQHLGLADQPSTSAPSKNTANGSRQEAVPDLLGGLEDESVNNAANDVAASNNFLGDLMDDAPQGQASSSNALFSGLDLGGNSAQAQQAPPSVTPPSTSQSNQVDLFGGLDTTGDAASASENSKAASAQTGGNHGLDDLLGGLGNSSEVANGGGLGGLAAMNQPLDSTAFQQPSGSITQTTSSGLADVFPGLSISQSSDPSLAATQAARSTSGNSVGGGLKRQPTPMDIANQRALSLEKNADPLNSLGLPQPANTPMGFGLSASQPVNPAMTQPSGMRMGGLGEVPQSPALPQQFSQLTQQQLQQLTPQQLQYLRQMQMQYMMQAAQGKAANPMLPPQLGQVQSAFQPPQHSLQQPSLKPSGLGSGFGAPLTTFEAPSVAPQSSKGLGISQQSDFDFVNDHVKGLRGKR